jgi:outer membrane protein W
MKKLLTLSLALFITLTVANAQSENYKPFKVDIGALYAVGTDDAFTGGIGFYLEPKYNVSDNIAVGLKWETAIIGGADELGENVSISAIGSYSLTGDYYFGDSGIRPFGGLGLGLYTLGSAEFSTPDGSTSLEVDYGSKFGFAPRIGVLLGHFRLAAEYNIITGIEEGLASKNYIAIKAGFEIGGGRK